jgi:uncharacterized protein (TIGR02646 family)
VIRIKSPQAPSILKNRGANETQRLCNLYDASPVDYQDGSKKLDFDSSLYAAKSVKNALLKAQHDKCCFCESKVSPIAYGDVEHYRPKAGYRQNADDTLGRPGYYWLAYEWSNLLFCCQMCNQRFKRNLFPLVDPGRRAETHHGDLSSEQPLFLHPGIDDPALFLDFREEYLFAIDENPRGASTIEALGLNREPLARMRRDHLVLFNALFELRTMVANKVSGQDAPDVELVRKHTELDVQIERYIRDSAQYAAASGATLRAAGLFS